MASKFLDENGVAYLIQKIKVWDNAKVDKETGKSLISDTEIARLANVTNYDDTALTALVNGKTTLAEVQALDYQTATQVQSAINSAISGISGIDFQVVSSTGDLPATGTKGTIYLVPNSGSGNNTYDEYVWVVISGTGRYEKIGTTEVDLSGYMQTGDMVAITNSEIDTIVSGSSGS